MNATEGRYIKLGIKGEWEDACLADGNMRIGYRQISHELCVSGDWDAVLASCQKHYDKSPKRFFNELKSFYESAHETVWITFSKGKMWWGIANGKVSIDSEGYKYRSLVDGWCSTDKNARFLDMQKLSGRLTRVAGYRGTICSIKDFDYVRRRINGIQIPEVEDARKSRAELLQSLEKLIARLTWKDFELFVDLVFVSAGWRRIGARGETVKDVDLDMRQPVTQERAMIQVKSSISQTDLQALANKTTQYDQYERIYLVTHSPALPIEDRLDTRFKLIGVTRLAELALGSVFKPHEQANPRRRRTARRREMCAPVFRSGC
jgi:hypothetical protein